MLESMSWDSEYQANLGAYLDTPGARERLTSASNYRANMQIVHAISAKPQTLHGDVIAAARTARHGVAGMLTMVDFVPDSELLYDETYRRHLAFGVTYMPSPQRLAHAASGSSIQVLDHIQSRARTQYLNLAVRREMSTDTPPVLEADLWSTPRDEVLYAGPWSLNRPDALAMVSWLRGHPGVLGRTFLVLEEESRILRASAGEHHKMVVEVLKPLLERRREGDLEVSELVERIDKGADDEGVAARVLAEAYVAREYPVQNNQAVF